MRGLAPTLISDVAMSVLVPPLALYLAFLSARMAIAETMRPKPTVSESADAGAVEHSQERPSLNDPLLPPAIESVEDVDNTRPPPSSVSILTEDGPAPTIEVRGLVKTFSKGGTRRSGGEFVTRLLIRGVKPQPSLNPNLNATLLART